MKKERLRRGYTTGTCAQAATKAAMQMLFSGKEVKEVEVILPKGERIKVEIYEIQMEFSEGEKVPVSVICAVKKDSGDDPDITNGVLVYSKVERRKEQGILLDGGIGIGRVTKPGLEQKIGEAAINRVPRMMIEKEVQDACEEAEYLGGIFVEISIPKGVELAKKTFNPRLGIEGGISILGTSGIVEPMSEQALLDTIRLEMKVRRAQGKEYLILAPGNYGVDFLKEIYGISEEDSVKCSNYIGQSLDMAVELGFRGVVLTGHIGKLIKVSGGVMNTHSKWADCRMELLAAAALRAGLGAEKACELLESFTTDDALEKVSEEERSRLMEQVMLKIESYLEYRVAGEMEVASVVYSKVYGILGKTKKADELMKKYGGSR